MIIAGHQSHYLPGMRYFAKIMSVDKFVLVDHVQFVKKEWQNRNMIKTQKGSLWLSVPVIVKGRFDQTINKVEIDNQKNWGRDHWRSIEFNYRKATYFEEYKDFFKAVYNRKWEKLVDINLEIINFLLKELGIKKEIIMSSTLNLTGKSTDLLVELCKKLGADTYMSGQQSKTYVDLEKIKAANLKHIFIKFNYPTYTQQFGSFLPNISTIDALLNIGGDETRKLLNASIEFEK